MTTGEGAGASQTLSTDTEAAFRLRETLRNSVDKLRDSNRQLQAAIDSGDSDPELRQAIGENIVVVAKYAAKIEELDRDLAAWRGAVASTSRDAEMSDADGLGQNEVRAPNSGGRPTSEVLLDDVIRNGDAGDPTSTPEGGVWL